MRTKKETKNLSLTTQIGVVFFLVGLIGGLYWYSQTRIFRLDRFLSDKVTGFIEFNALDYVKESDYPGFRNLIASHLKKDFYLDEPLDLEVWNPSKAALATFENKQRIWAFYGVNHESVKPWMESFLAEDEKFQNIKYNEGQIWMPSFSSSLGFAASGKWFFIATSNELLQEQFRSELKLKDREDYQTLFKDLPSKGVVTAFANTQEAIHEFASDPRFIDRKPVLQALGDSFTGFGMLGKMKNGHLTFYTKMLVHDGIFHKEFLKKKQKGIIPELASFVPQDGLYFMTGHDLYEKFQHSKTFLSGLHPQFSVIFEGILRAQSQDLFGKAFDFDKDFLSHMHGQYAVWIDNQGDFDEGMQYVFMTGFGGADKEQSLSHLIQAIRYAQSRFMSEVQVVELPDGTSREELVSVDPGDIPIRKMETDFGPYYTFEREADGKSFSFGFFNGSLVFSTSRVALERIVSVLDANTSSLSQNDDFRDSILFRYAPSESYGFINTSKVDKLNALLSGSDSSNIATEAFNLFKQDIRNISFARRVYPSEIFVTFTFFAR